MSTRPPMPQPADDLPVIEVNHLTKEYRLGAMQGMRATARRLLGRGSAHPSQGFKALDDVSFHVRRGEVVGIIGHNGAGKSTLLKHLCRITTPSSGSVTVRGRVAPLIEVGAGLVGDMTGRENIYLNASILGLSQSEIDSKVDEIIAFAELEKFIDTPIKRYSSGMQVRLGYAIATAVDSDVLIVDEVLAVGDLQFQRKSIERMQRLIHDSGKTVLIVGHNLRQLERVCTRAIMLDRGRILLDGSPQEVINKYYERTQDQERVNRQSAHLRSNWVVESSGELDVLGVHPVSGGAVDAPTHITFGQRFEIEIVIESTKRFDRVDIGIAFQTLDHIPVAISELTSAAARSFRVEEGRSVFRCAFPRISLMPGIYSLRVGIKDSWGQLLWGGNDVMSLEVAAPDGSNRARFSDFAMVQFECQWSALEPDREQTVV